MKSKKISTFSKKSSRNREILEGFHNKYAKFVTEELLKVSSLSPKN